MSIFRYSEYTMIVSLMILIVIGCLIMLETFVKISCVRTLISCLFIWILIMMEKSQRMTSEVWFIVTLLIQRVTLNITLKFVIWNNYVIQLKDIWMNLITWVKNLWTLYFSGKVLLYYIISIGLKNVEKRGVLSNLGGMANSNSLLESMIDYIGNTI